MESNDNKPGPSRPPYLRQLKTTDLNFEAKMEELLRDCLGESGNMDAFDSDDTDTDPNYTLVL